MARLPLYYFNVLHAPDVLGMHARSSEVQQSTWTEIENIIDSLQPLPKKMYHESLFTFNNTLLVFPPEDVPKALSDIYRMPEGYSKRILLKLADMGTSLVPCEEHELLTAWQKNESDLLRKEAAGETVSPEEIGRQTVYLLTRNKVIGQVIAQTLSEDEAGVLFLGAVHNLEGMMANNYLKETLGLNVIELNPHVRRSGKEHRRDTFL
jgi:hypothetical protein